MLKHKLGPYCHECPLQDAPGPIPGKGSIRAPILVLGMAPADQEIEFGYPFAGGAGRILNRGLFNAGINRERDCYLTNIVKCYVPAKTNLPREAIRCCKPILDDELGYLSNLKITATCGAEPFKALTGLNLHIMHSIKAAKKDSKYWLRGNIYRADTSSQTAILPLEHPASIAYGGFQTSPLFEADMSKLKRWSDGMGLCWNETMNYNPTEQEVIDYVNICLQLGRFGLDIETPETVTDPNEEEYSAQKSPIDVIGISHTIGSCLGIPPQYYHLLEPLLHSNATCYAFNWGFDGYHLRTHFPKMSVKAFDVMIALHLLYSDNSPQDLATALSLFTDMPYHKNLMATAPDLYNARDTYGALYAGLECEKLLNYYSLRYVFEQHETPCIDVVSDLQHRGARCSVQTAEQMELFCTLALQQYEAFWKETLPGINWRSSEQLLPIFESQGLPIRKARRKRKDGTIYYSATLDEETLKDYADNHNSQLAALILEMRTLSSSYKFCYPYSDDGFMHARYKQHGTGTGRFSAKNPNPQNIPEEVGNIRPREIVVPDEYPNDEGVIILSDFSQFELWIYAWIAQDEGFLEAKRRGDYIHGIMYETFFKEPFFEANMPKQKIYARKDIAPWKLLKAKTFPLGMLYGRGEESIRYGGFPAEEARIIYNNFHRDHPAIKAMHRKLTYEVERKGYLQNIFGRMRRFPNLQKKNEFLSFPGQSNAADLLRKLALIPLHKHLADFSARLILTVHDSTGVTCPKRNAIGCASFIKDCMEAPVEQMSGYYFPVEQTIGPSWGNTEPLETFILKQSQCQTQTLKSR